MGSNDRSVSPNSGLFTSLDRIGSGPVPKSCELQEMSVLYLFRSSHGSAAPCFPADRPRRRLLSVFSRRAPQDRAPPLPARFRCTAGNKKRCSTFLAATRSSAHIFLGEGRRGHDKDACARARLGLTRAGVQRESIKRKILKLIGRKIDIN